jgi:hypothetical protein
MKSSISATDMSQISFEKWSATRNRVSKISDHIPDQMTDQGGYIYAGDVYIRIQMAAGMGLRFKKKFVFASGSCEERCDTLDEAERKLYGFVCDEVFDLSH